MARYCFDVRKGNRRAFDQNGLELSDQDRALAEAAWSLVELARDKMSKHTERHQIVIEVRDTGGPVTSVEVISETDMIQPETAVIRDTSRPSMKEMFRLLEAFYLACPETKDQIVALAEQYADCSTGLQKSKTKH